MRRILCSIALVSLFLAPASAEWNQWRGPARTGEVPGEGWPSDFSNLQKVWEIPLGKGYAGPIVSGDRVFVVESVDKKNAAVKALKRSDGSEIWRHDWPSHGSVPFFAAANGDWVRSTPAWDGETLLVWEGRSIGRWPLPGPHEELTDQAPPLTSTGQQLVVLPPLPLSSGQRGADQGGPGRGGHLAQRAAGGLLR